MSDNSGNRSSLGAMISQLRGKIGLSQAQLATEAEIRQGYLSQIENNKVQNPSAAVLHRLAKALEVDPYCLFEAVGYGELLTSLQDAGFVTQVYPPLLKHLSKYTPEQQRSLLEYMKSIENGVHDWEPRVGAEH